MKKSRVVVCALVFTLICALTLALLSLFTDDATPILGFIDWTSCEIIGADGAARSFDENDPPPWDWQPGESFRIAATLPGPEENPLLYEDPGYIVVEGLGMELTASVDGRELVYIRYPDRGQQIDLCQIQLALTPEDAGKELELRYTPSNEEVAQYPLFARFASDSSDIRFYYAIATRSSLAAGAYILGFVLICAIFLISAAIDRPDWSLLLLAPVAFLAGMTRLSQLSGIYFLSRPFFVMLSRSWIQLLMIGLLLLYLFFNRKERFWHYLGRVTLVSLAAAAVLYGLDSLGQGRFVEDVNLDFQLLVLGDPRELIGDICLYLTTACGSIAAYSLVRRLLEMRSCGAALALRNQLITENYGTIRQSVESTSLMRHEWKNQVAVLQVLAKRGDIGELREAIGELGGRLDKLAPKEYCEHFTVNILLQNAAARAQRMGVSFSASAIVPPELPVQEPDLCSLLLNLLDNALEAAGAAPEGKRTVTMGIRLNQGYLTVRCENGYSGPLSFDSEGRLRTTKTDPGSHGLGLLQVRAVAEKYRGMFDIQYSRDVFIATASLKLPDR